MVSYPVNRKKDESQETDFKDAVEVCLPLINAAIRDIEKGTFPKDCFLNIEIPRSPLSNKVGKLYYMLEDFIFSYVSLRCANALVLPSRFLVIYCTESRAFGYWILMNN